jgi:hypothetical protein
MVGNKKGPFKALQLFDAIKNPLVIAGSFV